MSDEGESKPSPAWGHISGAIKLQSDPEILDRKLLSERVLITERIYRYGWAFDERQEKLLEECFTEDATWEANIMGVNMVGPHDGREAIITFMKGFWPSQFDQRRHLIMNVIVDSQDAESATVFAYHLLISASKGALTPVTSGFYRASMKRLNGSWKIKSLLAGYDIPF